MKTKTIYCCEYCEFTSENQEETFDHELRSHIHLEHEEFVEWIGLKCRVKLASSRLFYTRNARNKLNKVIEELAEFETKHNLKGVHYYDSLD